MKQGPTESVFFVMYLFLFSIEVAGDENRVVGIAVTYPPLDDFICNLGSDMNISDVSVLSNRLVFEFYPGHIVAGWRLSSRFSRKLRAHFEY